MLTVLADVCYHALHLLLVAHRRCDAAQRHHSCLVQPAVGPGDSMTSMTAQQNGQSGSSSYPLKSASDQVSTSAGTKACVTFPSGRHRTEMHWKHIFGSSQLFVPSRGPFSEQKQSPFFQDSISQANSSVLSCIIV
jgi:hypothetical protein